ncbi:MAG TPA: peptide chain release factor N(5)-glutamine methyltransferase [Gemmatimonadaceae bacterium]|nr:peptide chain release factor N(5)-glutamine methyltransferase [Gemmatimonadaceae bacterium]
MPDTTVRPHTGGSHAHTVREFGEGLATIIGGDASRQDARELLSLVWDRTPAWLAAHADDGVPREIREAAQSAAGRVAAGAPMAYATGRVAFRNLVLNVDQRALIPRPETEIVVEVALRVCRTGLAVDVGTGSGAIALALATEGSFDRVIATDVSEDALAVARVNVNAVETPCTVELRCGSLLRPVMGEAVNLIVANPPYIAAPEISGLPSDVRDWEPPVALVSGSDGLAHTRELILQSTAVLSEGGWLVLEVDSRRAGEAAAIAGESGAFSGVRIFPDLTGRPRVLTARRGAALTPETIA